MNDEDLRVMIWAMLRKLDGKQLRLAYRFVRGLRAADEGTTSSSPSQEPPCGRLDSETAPAGASVSASSADTFPKLGEGSV